MLLCWNSIAQLCCSSFLLILIFWITWLPLSLALPNYAARSSVISSLELNFKFSVTPETLLKNKWGYDVCVYTYNTVIPHIADLHLSLYCELWNTIKSTEIGPVVSYINSKIKGFVIIRWLQELFQTARSVIKLLHKKRDMKGQFIF